MSEQTLAIIKPDAMQKRIIGEIISQVESRGFRMAAAQMKQLTRDEARLFYVEHKDRPFYAELVAFMTSGPVLVMVLEGKGAVHTWRQLMGHTNPAQAELGTLRKKYGASISQNVVHGSDSAVSAKREVDFFFDKTY